MPETVEENNQKVEVERYAAQLLDLQQKAHLLGVIGEMISAQYPLVGQQLKLDIENTIASLVEMKRMTREQLNEQVQQFMKEGRDRVDDGWLNFDEPGFLDDLDHAEGYLTAGRSRMTDFGRNVFTTHPWEERGRSWEEQPR